ncbi:MAG: CRISPR-associated endonuclease Cas1 [Candidatus Tokpelaia hoelldobleri]|uniref:CRISPR-associated endonuclease Cas1 n=1 Tax=Candidatus Tokpelaia hoelldobleri TaxID=1902579 RepID=A0A1U9JU02_9HYPH|nr:MAG: CRISPR-associated endonuclease Cas1 [Candidatus Tokpelaia hoelldoblerii]
MDRIVDIETDGQHLAIYRGFLTVSKSGEEIGRIAVDDIGALIVHAHGITWSNHVFVRLSEAGIPVVLCAQNHAPVSIVWPLEGHHVQHARMKAQMQASRPLQKQLWAQIVTAKVRMQGQVIKAAGQNNVAFDMLARKVRSGDPQNIEAQAARKYWQLLFGSDFRRDKNRSDANALLNYGYTVLRAIVSRAICGSGLHPTLGIFHSNSYNAFALSDDLMEPFRPVVDIVVRNLIAAGKYDVDPETKSSLTSISTFDLEGVEGTSPLTLHITRLVHSLAKSFEAGKAELVFPRLPSHIELCSLGISLEEEEVSDSLS